MSAESVTHDCPFPDCDWSHEYTTLENGQPIDDFPTALHYEEEHGGRIRVLATIEYEQILGDRSPDDVRKRVMERLNDDGYNVAYVRSEVIEEPDDHSQLENNREQ